MFRPNMPSQRATTAGPSQRVATSCFDNLLPRRYEKARKLKDHIGKIREDYTKLWESRIRAERQVRSTQLL